MASVAMLSVSAGAAFADDFGKQTSQPAQLSINWSGCYVGLHAGAAGGASNWTSSDAYWNMSGVSGHVSGALGGAQAGCNYQMQNFVLGAEGEIWGSGLTGDASFADFEGTTRLKTRSDFGSDLAVRAGYAVDRALLYGKIGVAWADYRFTDSYDFEGFTETGANTEAGLLLGFGVEYAFDPHWSVKGEFDYVNFGSRNVPLNGDNAYVASIRTDQDIFKIGANYRY